MRFEVTRVLDSIERRLCIDPSVARAVVDLAPIVRQHELDGGRAVSLLRLGLVIDALGQLLSEPGASVYVVVDRALLADLELTSNEKMVLRRWADDGLVEALAEVGDRVPEVAACTGLPIISRADLSQFAGAHPWLTQAPQRLLRPVPGVGGAVLVSQPAPPGPSPAPQLDPTTRAILGRYWRCSEPGCVAFGAPATSQPPPRIRGGRPRCPQHDQPLMDAGQRQPSVPIAIWIAGAQCGRFTLSAGQPIVVGRSPDDPNGIRLGPLLDEEALQWVSRNHLRLELVSGGLAMVTDTSTNGTTVHVRAGRDTAPTRVQLARGEGRTLGEWDVVELHEGVVLSRADRQRAAGPAAESPVMAEAPTIAIKLPGAGPPA